MFSSKLPNMLPITLSIGKTLPISHDYILPCMLLGVRFWGLLGNRWQVPRGGGWEADSRWQVMVAEIITSVNIMVQTIVIPEPLCRDLTMPSGHGVDNCSLTFCRNSRQLDLGESRFPTQIFQRNLLPAFHQLWLYAFVFSLRLMVMIRMVMAMMMIAMVMVLVMVIMVLEAYSQVG